MNSTILDGFVPAPDRPLAKLASAGLCLAAWANADLTNTVSVVVACATTLVLGYTYAAGKIDEGRRSRHKLDFDEEMRQRKADFDVEMIERKAREDADRESLTAQLGAMKAAAEKVAAEADNDRKKMRDTEHKINDQLNVLSLENADLRKSFIEVTGQLVEANTQLAVAHARLDSVAIQAKGGAS